MRAGDAPFVVTASPEPPAGAEDRALVERLRHKDEAAFLSLIDRHHGAMIRVAQTMVPSRAVAEEVVQETWQAVISGLGSFEGRSSLRTWMFRILVKRARTRSARELRSLPVASFSDARDGENAPLRAVDGGQARAAVPASDLTPERALLDGELRSRLEAAIEGLPEQLREVLTMRDVAGCTSADVCSVLEITEANQRVMLHRARLRVRGALMGYLGGKP